MLKSACISKAVSRPCSIGGGLRPYPCGVPLGGRGHRFGAAVDDAHRLAGDARGDREQRLDRDVELAAEPAAAGGRPDAHLVRLDAEHARGLVAVHVGRLRAGGDLHPPADRNGEACLRLDVGVLDKARLEAALDGRGRRRRGRLRRRRISGCRGSARCRARAHGGRASRPPMLHRRRTRPAAATSGSAGRRRTPPPPLRACRPAPAPPRRGSAHGRAPAPAGPSDARTRRRSFRPARPSPERMATSPGVRCDDGVEIAERESPPAHAGSAPRASRAHRPARHRRRRGRCPSTLAQPIGARKAGADDGGRVPSPPCGEGATEQRMRACVRRRRLGLMPLTRRSAATLSPQGGEGRVRCATSSTASTIFT